MTRPSLVTRFHVLLLSVIVAITAIAIYKVPAGEGLAMHWDARGQSDWTWPRDIAFAVVPLAGLAITAIFAIGGALTPKSRLEMARHILEPALSGVLAVGVGVQFGLLMIGIGSDFDIIRLLAFALAALLLILGILLREAERNTYAGLRLPWAMPDDATWRRTHQLAGWAYIAGAVVLAVLAWLQPFPATLIIVFPFVLAVPPLLARLTTLGVRHD